MTAGLLFYSDDDDCIDLVLFLCGERRRPRRGSIKNLKHVSAHCLDLFIF